MRKFHKETCALLKQSSTNDAMQCTYSTCVCKDMETSRRWQHFSKLCTFVNVYLFLNHFINGKAMTSDISFISVPHQINSLNENTNKNKPICKSRKVLEDILR